MIDLPSFYEFDVDEEFVSFFEKKMEYYKEVDFLMQKGSTATYNGHQTSNILNLNEKDVNKKLTSLRERLERKCGVKLEYHWVHLIEYEEGGNQSEHRHDHNEDYSVIVYLNSCDDGSTYFVLNKERGVVLETFPIRSRCVMFSSSILHGCHPTSSGKKILVLGLKLV